MSSDAGTVPGDPSRVLSNMTDRRSSGAAPVLSVERLRVSFVTAAGLAEVVSEVSFSIGPGRTLCLVGESGCGKSVAVMAILGLLPTRRCRIAADAVRFEGLDLRDPSGRNLRKVRGRRIGMI